MLGSWLTTKARKRLTAWAEGTLKPHREEEFAAWRELTRVTWQHGIASGIVGFLVVVLPIFFIIYTRSGAISSPFQPTSLAARLTVARTSVHSSRSMLDSFLVWRQAE